MKHKNNYFSYSGLYSCLFFLLILSQSLYAPSAGAEILVPLHIKSGTNLIHIARKYCSKQSDWPLIAKINKLKSPYTIRANQTLQIPLSILRTKDVAARVASINGTPKLITTDSKILALREGDDVLPGQTIVTGANEYVHLLYPDHKHTRIGPQSEMALTYLLRLTDNSLKAEFSLKKGRITHSVEQKLKANENFNTRTPIAITGIRGTEFRIKVKSSEANIVETLKGAVTLSASGKKIVLNKGKGSKVKKGMPPEMPRSLPATPDIPVFKDIYRVLPAVITAPAHTTAKTIRMRITADSDGQTTLLEKRTEPGKDFTLFSLTDGRYYAIFTAIDKQGFESLPSSPAPLQIRTIPAAPIVSKPNNDLQTFEPAITIQWLTSELASSYFLQVATDPDFTNIIDSQELQKNTFSTKNMVPGKYFFRVRLIAADGFTTLFSPSLKWEVIEQPKLGEMGSLEQNDDGIVLRWAPIAKMSGYAIQVATDKEFTDLLVNDDSLTEPTYTIQEDLAPGNHYIRIAAIMENGQRSPWTPTQTLTVDSVSPGILHFLIGLGFVALILL